MHDRQKIPCQQGAVHTWLRVLKKSERNGVLVSAYRSSGHFWFPPWRAAEAVKRYWSGWMRLCGMDQAIMGCGGGLAV